LKPNIKLFDKDIFGKTNDVSVWMPMPGWDDFRGFGNFVDQGFIFLTDGDTKPQATTDWEVVPCAVPEGFGCIDGKWKYRHLHTLEQEEEKVYSIFVGIAVG
jgi:hypothetical protein